MGSTPVGFLRCWPPPTMISLPLNKPFIRITQLPVIGPLVLWARSRHGRGAWPLTSPGHLLMEEHPEQMTDLLREFLTGSTQHQRPALAPTGASAYLPARPSFRAPRPQQLVR